MVDVSDPASPGVIASLPIGQISSVATSGNLAFAGGVNELRVIDITFPGLPVPRGTLLWANGESVAASGDYAFVFYTPLPTDSLWVVDASDPDLPVVVEGLLMNDPSDLRVSGTHLYVVDRAEGLHVLDISTPSSPVIVGTVALPDLSIPERLTVDGQIVYVSDMSTGIAVVDVSDPLAPESIGYIEPPSTGPSNMAVSGDLLYVVYDPESGPASAQILVYDVSDPASPVEVGAICPPDAASVGLSGDHLYVAAKGDGVATYVQQCGAIVGVSSTAPVVTGAGLRVFPSPSSGPVTIELDLDHSLDGVVEIFDAAGRRVRRITYPARVTALSWDGRDDDGRSAAPGVYWVRQHSASGNSPLARKVVLITPN